MIRACPCALPCRSAAVRLTHCHHVALLQRAGRAHRVRLSGAGLAVCQQRDIVALDEGVDAVGDVVPDAVLLGVLAEDAVEDEELAALGRVDGEARVGGYVDHGALEALWYELEAGVGLLERRAHSYGCRPGGEEVSSVVAKWRTRRAGWREIPSHKTRQRSRIRGRHYSQTLTAVLASSSEARLPPPALLPMLRRLLLRCPGRTIALMGLWGRGEAGGELAMAAGGTVCALGSSRRSSAPRQGSLAVGFGWGGGGGADRDLVVWVFWSGWMKLGGGESGAKEAKRRACGGKAGAGALYFPWRAWRVGAERAPQGAAGMLLAKGGEGC